MAHKVRSGVLALLASLGLVGVMAGSASAQTTTPDPETVAAINDGFAQIKALYPVLAGALFTLVVVGLGIALGIRYLKKGAHAA
jgi:hypothetical protein